MARFTELDRYLLGQATHYNIYEKMGRIRARSEKRPESALMFGLPMRPGSM